MNVWVLVIEHDHGLNVSAHADEQHARDALAAYVEQWWDHEVDGDDWEDDAMPAERDKAIEAYFEIVEGESYLLQEVTVLGLDERSA